MAIGKTNAQALAGKQTASGTFSGTGQASQAVSVSFVPKYVQVILQSTSDEYPANSTISICFDFNNNYGWIAGRVLDNMNTLNVGYSGNSSLRPSYSSGTLTLYARSSTYAPFYTGYTYEWFASE